MKRTKSMIYKESAESRELELYAVNTGRLYRSSIVPVVRNLHKKYVKGTYNPDKAVDSYYAVASEAAKMYEKEFCSCSTFTVQQRFTVAVELEKYYRENVEAGDL